MPQELEIKLTVSSTALIKAHNWLLSQARVEGMPALELVNRYYDTPAADLKRQRAALRVRDTGTGFIQTLKTQGEFAQGAHRRQEWEWPVKSAELDLSLLAQTPLDESVPLAELKPVFETNFQRRLLRLDDDQARIECAFDDGHIEAGGQRRPLHEIELELESGDEERLLAWARRLAEVVPVFLNPVSKAQQGYHLAGIAPGLAILGSEPIERFFQNLGRLWLTGAGAGEVLGSLDEIEPLAREADQLSHWRWLRQTVAEQGADAFSQLLEDKRLGCLQLALLR